METHSLPAASSRVHAAALERFAAGRAHAAGRDWRFTARLTRPGGDGAVGVDVTLDGLAAVQGLGGTLSAQIQADGTVLGRVAMRGPDLSQLLAAPAVPFRLDGRLTMGGGLVAADELVGEVAGSPVQGAVALRLAPVLRLDVALSASRLDLDAWVPALLRAADGEGGARLPVGIDLSAEAAGLAVGFSAGLATASGLALAWRTAAGLASALGAAAASGLCAATRVLLPRLAGVCLSESTATAAIKAGPVFLGPV